MSEAENRIYFILCRELGAVKIGTSYSVARRLAELQTAHPFPLQLIGTLRVSRDNERQIHGWIDSHRLSGEWFTFAPIEALILEFLTCAQGSLATRDDVAAYIRQRVESFCVSPDLREWATTNAPHVNVERLTERWRMTVRNHNYQNAKGLVESASGSWKLAMLDAERKELNRERTPASAGLATKHGIRYYEDVKLERELRQVSPAVTSGSLDPVLCVRSNG